MATQTIAVPSAPLQFPQAIPAAEILQVELIHLIEARNTLDALRKHVEGLESKLKSPLEAHATVQTGVQVARMKECFRRSVAWREVSRSLADELYGVGKGESYCESVLESTKPSRSVSLVIK